MSDKRTNLDQPSTDEKSRPDQVSVSEKMLVWSFVVVFIAFGLLLLADTLNALWR